MRKLLGWIKKPITWGSYFKICGVSMIILAIGSLAYWTYCRLQIRDIYGEIDDVEEQTE